MNKIENLKLVSARVYIGGEVHLIEDQWAQITLKINNGQQYAVFERRLDDRLSYLGWKLTFLFDQSDFEFIHSKHKYQYEQELDKGVQLGEDIDEFKQNILNRKKVRKELYI